jgi:hypothetical protein
MEFSFFETISELGLTLDHIFILSFIKNNTIEGLKDKKTQKVKGILNTLKRKNIIDEEGNINPNYLEFANAFATEKIDYEKLVNKVKDVNNKEKDSFEIWWETYPKTDTFTYQGIKFTGNRALRQSKADCKAKFKILLMEGYNPDKLIQALRVEVTQKMMASVRTRSNKLSFMQNSLTYLNKRTFDSYIDIEEEEEKNETKDDNIVNFQDVNI